MTPSHLRRLPPRRDRGILDALPRLVLLALLVPASGGITRAGDAGTDVTPLWERSFPTRVRWYSVTEAGVLAVGTDQGIFGVSPEEGRSLWELSRVHRSKERFFQPVEGTPFALVRVGRGPERTGTVVALIDLRTGEPAWTLASIGVAKAHGHHHLPEIGSLFVVGVKSGKPKSFSVFVVSLKTGALLWENDGYLTWVDPDRFEGIPRWTVLGIPRPVADGSGAMYVFYPDRILRKHDARSGEVLWQAEVPLPRQPRAGGRAREKVVRSRDLPDPFAGIISGSDGATIYVSHHRTVDAFRARDGERLWRRRQPLPGRVVQMEELPEGLILETVSGGRDRDGEHSVLKIDRGNGELAWAHPGKGESAIQEAFRSWSGATNFVVEDGRVLVGAGDDLLAIDVATGAKKRIAETDLEDTSLSLDLIDLEKSLEAVNGGYLLRSSQNVLFVERNGKKRFHIYHEPPDRVRDVDVLDWIFDPIRGLAQQFHFSIETQEDEGYVYMLTEIPRKFGTAPGIVKVRKTDGTTVGELPMRTSHPSYRIDGSGRAIVRAGKNGIACYEFQPWSGAP